MKVIKHIVIAAATLAIAGPAFAGRDGTQLIAQERAMQAKRVKSASASQGSSAAAAPTPATYNKGHPTERTRR